MKGMDMQVDFVAQLKTQNRLLKFALTAAIVLGGAALMIAAKSPDARQKFSEIDVERINVRDQSGKLALVISNRQRLPKAIINGKPTGEDRNMPGLIFYNELGDENGGFIFNGNLGKDGKPNAGMHFSMDRFGGDQQLALGHYERNGFMSTGLNIYDRGLESEYGRLYEQAEKAPAGPEKDALLKKWKEAGGQQTQRVFVGKTLSKSSAVVLADAQGRPRIMMIVTPEGQAELQFMDEKGKVTHTYPPAVATATK
jgi:hypothetical protein